WSRSVKQDRRGLLVPGLLTIAGVTLLLVARKTEYFANISRWLADASMIKQVGTPHIVSSRLFTIWVALLGGSLATGGGRQINIDVVMRFLGPRPRLVVALIGYLAAATSCFTIAWAFIDYVSITGYGADKDAKAGEKVSAISAGVGRHLFIVRKQLVLDLRSIGHVVFKGEKFDEWYSADEWNADLNDGGWASVYPPPAPKEALPAGASYATKPCVAPAEAEAAAAQGVTPNPEWMLPGVCGEAGSKRPPLATAPDPDDGAPLDGDLALLFPWGFFMIGCRFLLRGALAAGGAVSTDPNAAHGGDGDRPPDPTILDPLVARHEPIVEKAVDEEARAHVGEDALPPDDASVSDALDAAKAVVDAGADDIDNAKRGLGGEPVHHKVDDVGDPQAKASIKDTIIGGPALSDEERAKGLAERQSDKKRLRAEDVSTLAYGSDEADEQGAKKTAPPPAKMPSMPPEGMPTAERLEVAQKFADEDEDERTMVGDLSELARAQELLAKKEEDDKRRRIEEAAKKKKEKGDK
ncbi:MAG: TRAP transporter small permease subunit, partial [Polyangiales bacterium]